MTKSESRFRRRTKITGHSSQNFSKWHGAELEPLGHKSSRMVTTNWTTQLCKTDKRRHIIGRKKLVDLGGSRPFSWHYIMEEVCLACRLLQSAHDDLFDFIKSIIVQYLAISHTYMSSKHKTPLV